MLRELFIILSTESTVVLHQTINVRVLGFLLRLDAPETITTEVVPIVGCNHVLGAIVRIVAVQVPVLVSGSGRD